MKLFIDTGSVAEVEELAPWGALSGATTNPSLLAREGSGPTATIRRLCELLDGPVSAEAVSDNPRELVAQGRGLAAVHHHVVVKLPFGPAGLAATRELAEDGIRVNMTLVFSAAQALLSAEAGATYISCFLGRLDDIGQDAGSALAEVIATLDAAESRPQVLAASIRSARHAVEAAKLGADVATIPAAVLRQMTTHPLTAAGIERFTRDWAADPALAAWLRELAGTVPASRRLPS
jgi:transaldolase